MAKKLTLGVQFRAAEVDGSSIDEEKRTARLSFSSEFPVQRSFGYEILDHSPKSVRLDRLRNKGPVLIDHDSRDLVGVVEAVKVSGRGEAVVRFSRNQKGEEVFRDVLDGIRNHVSVGYRIHDMEPDGERDGVEAYRVTDWEPLEISMVGVPADPTVGMDRSYEIVVQEKDKPMNHRGILLDPTPADGGGNKPNFDAEAERRRIESEVRSEFERKQRALAKRNAEIDAIASRSNNNKTVLDLAAEFKSDENRTLDEFRAQVIPHLITKPEAFQTKPASEGMNRKELQQYSFTRAFRSKIETGSVGGLERELSDEVAKRIGKTPVGFFVPTDVLYKTSARALEVGTFTGAGAFVEAGAAGQSLIELLRNSMAVMAMGATPLSGLTSDVDIPRQTGGGTASWLGEGAALTRADQTVGQLALRPHRLAASTAYTKQLLAQSSQDVESFVRNDLMTVIAIAKDLACISGSGASGQPLGIINTSGLSTAATHTSGGIFTWAQALDYEAHVETNNALNGSLGYLMTPADKSTAKATPRDTGAGTFVWDVATNTVNGYKAMASNQMAAGAGGTIFGNWSDLIVADWDGMDVVVDPYSLSLNGQISIVIQTLTDCGLRHPESFSISTA